MFSPSSLSSYKEISSRVTLYLSVGRYEIAERLLIEKIEIIESESTDHHTGEHARLYNLLGLVYHKQSQFNKALNCFERSWQIQGSFVEARLNYAVTLCDLGHYDKAHTSTEECLEHTDKQSQQTQLTLERLADRHEELGDLYLRCDMKVQARTEYQKALTLTTDNPPVRLKLAQMLLRSGHIEQAQRELETILTDPGCGEQARCWLGIIALREGRGDKALQHWQSYESPQTKLLKAFRSLAHLWKGAPLSSIIHSPSTPPSHSSDGSRGSGHPSTTNNPPPLSTPPLPFTPPEQPRKPTSRLPSPSSYLSAETKATPHRL